MIKITFNKYYKNNNSSLADKYLIQIYNFIAIWKAKKDNEKKMQYKR